MKALAESNRIFTGGLAIETIISDLTRYNIKEFVRRIPHLYGVLEFLKEGISFNAENLGLVLAISS